MTGPARRGRAEFFARAPGAEAMERLFERLEDELFCLKDREGRYVAVNPAFQRHCRVEQREQVLGRTAREIFPALLAAGYEQQDALVFARGIEVRDRLEMITNPDGSAGWFLTDKVPVRDAAGAVIGLAALSHDLHAPTADDPRLGRLARAVDRMRAEFATPLRIAALAAEAGLSLSRFERAMRAVLRVSPRQFLTRLRLEAAAEALRSGRRPLAEIAVESGFCDQQTFSKQFKTATGLTPLVYRRMAKEG